MYVPPEIIVLFFLISFLVYTMPSVLVNFSHTLRGKILLLLLTIVITIYNRTGGIIMAMLFIFLSEFNYEFNNRVIYEGFTVEDMRDAMLVNSKKQDKLTVEEALKSRDSAKYIITN
jgi:hypothetical protein